MLLPEPGRDAVDRHQDDERAHDDKGPVEDWNGHHPTHRDDEDSGEQPEEHLPQDERIPTDRLLRLAGTLEGRALGS